jgi:hypothetical protein
MLFLFFLIFLFLFKDQKVGGVLGLRESTQHPTKKVKNKNVVCLIHTYNKYMCLLSRSKLRLCLGFAWPVKAKASKRDKIIGQNNFKRDVSPKLSVKIKLDKN